MDRDAFWDLHKLIRDNPIFQTPPGRRRQRPSHIQLATFLCYVGGESGIKTAAFSGITEGTVWEYMRRCNHAIRCLRDDFIAWPTEAHRDWISDFMEECGFPGCVGSADGTYFRAGRKPVSNGYAFYCHKGFYAVCTFIPCAMNVMYLEDSGLVCLASELRPSWSHHVIRLWLAGMRSGQPSFPSLTSLATQGAIFP